MTSATSPPSWATRSSSYELSRPPTSTACSTHKHLTDNVDAGSNATHLETRGDDTRRGSFERRFAPTVRTPKRYDHTLGLEEPGDVGTILGTIGGSLVGDQIVATDERYIDATD